MCAAHGRHTYNMVTPQWCLAPWMTESYSIRPIRATVGETVRGPTKLVMKPTKPVRPTNTCATDATANDPEI